MATANNIKQRIKSLEHFMQPLGQTHYGWNDGDMTEESYRKENNIPAHDSVILIRWQQ